MPEQKEYTTADAIRECCFDDGSNIVHGLFAIADALKEVAKSIDRLGNANADTPMGAVEGLAHQIKESTEQLCHTISESRPGD